MGQYRANLNLPGHPYGVTKPLRDDDPVVERRVAAGSLVRVDAEPDVIVDQTVEVVPVVPVDDLTESEQDAPPEAEPIVVVGPDSGEESVLTPAQKRAATRAANKAKAAAEAAEGEPEVEVEGSDAEGVEGTSEGDLTLADPEVAAEG